MWEASLKYISVLDISFLAPYKMALAVDARGACLCGGVTFELSGPPEAVLKCYCDHCQKNAGGPFQIVCLSLTQFTGLLVLGCSKY